jgi:hypothetical protein
MLLRRFIVVMFCLLLVHNGSGTRSWVTSLLPIPEKVELQIQYGMVNEYLKYLASRYANNEAKLGNIKSENHLLKNI